MFNIVGWILIGKNLYDGKEILFKKWTALFKIEIWDLFHVATELNK